MAPKARPVLAHSVPGCVLATWHNVLLGTWGTPGTVALAARLSEITVALDKAHPEGFSSVHIIVAGAGLPDAEARRALEKVATGFAGRLACVGTVIDGDGFWGSAIRSFFISLSLLSRQPYKSHYAGTERQLARWLVGPHAERTGVTLSPADVEQALREVRGWLK